MTRIRRFIIVLTVALILGGIASADARSAGSTAYCLQGTMADGSYTRTGSIAMNSLPLGSIIRLHRSNWGPNGRRTFHVRDRIGYGSELDFWVPTCSAAYQWGRRRVTYYVMRYGYRWRA